MNYIITAKHHVFHMLCQVCVHMVVVRRPLQLVPVQGRAQGAFSQHPFLLLPRIVVGSYSQGAQALPYLLVLAGFFTGASVRCSVSASAGGEGQQTQ